MFWPNPAVDFYLTLFITHRSKTSTPKQHLIHFQVTISIVPPHWHLLQSQHTIYFYNSTLQYLYVIIILYTEVSERFLKVSLTSTTESVDSKLDSGNHRYERELKIYINYSRKNVQSKHFGKYIYYLYVN